MFSNASGCVDQYAKLIIFLYWQQTSRDNTYGIHRNKSLKDMRHLYTENYREEGFLWMFCSALFSGWLINYRFNYFKIKALVNIEN